MLEIAKEYHKKEWAPLPIPFQSKKPVLDEWQNLRLTEDELLRYFNGQTNIGVLLGEASGGLVDIDLDCIEAVLAAPFFLSVTGCIFGRPSKQRSHLLYKCNPVPSTKKFQTQEDGMIVELRSNGGQTVFPGSVHPSGEEITWHKNDEPAEVDPEILLKQVAKLAAAALLARHWSGEGSRQDAALALSGGLLRAGWTEQDAANFIKGVVVAAKDAEEAKRVECVRFTARKIASNQAVTGWNTLNNLIGGNVVKKVLEWLGIRGDLFEWPEPESIQSEVLLPVEELPPAIIPEPFRPWLSDIAYRMQCPIDFVAAAAVVVTGAVIGAGCGIRPKQHDDWLIAPNLWGGVVARPSQLKTPALAEVLKPLSRLEAAAKEEYESDIRDYEAEFEAYKAQKDALKSKMLAAAKGKAKGNEKLEDINDIKADFSKLEEPPAPTRRRYRTNDATVEKMSELLNENPRGILLFRDELIGLLVSWDKEGRETDRAFYLEAWNGYGNFTTDRIGRGTIDTENMCVSVLGGIQPAKLLGYLYQSMSELHNDGLMQRMQLLVYPDEPAKWKLVDKWPDTEAKNRAFEVLNKLATMDFAEYGANLDKDEKMPYFRFSTEAQELFDAWVTELHTDKLKRDDAPVILEHLGKYRSLLPTLALIFHLIEIADGKASGPVSHRAAAQAAAWCDYLESHMRRIYGLVGDMGTRAASELAKRIKKGALTDGFSIRDVYRNCWHLLDKKEVVQDACTELVEAGWLREEIKQDGRTRKVYRINPKIFPASA